jgi:hypothetical protein
MTFAILLANIAQMMSKSIANVFYSTLAIFVSKKLALVNFYHQFRLHMLKTKVQNRF